METCTSLGGELQHPTLVVSELDGEDFVGQGRINYSKNIFQNGEIIHKIGVVLLPS